MIVISPRYPRLASGSGFADIFKKITKQGLKKVINKATSSSIAHKLADAVVDGVVSGAENAIIDTLKRKGSTGDGGTKTLKIDLTDLINGSGIVLD